MPLGRPAASSLDVKPVIDRSHVVLLLRRLQRLGVKIPEHLEVTFVSDRVIRHLNQRYLGHDTATDVLAFSLGTHPGLPGEWAQIVISLQTAVRYAKRLHQPWRRECDRYLIHGLLHLSGYDDRLPINRRLMHLREEELLEETRNQRDTKTQRRNYSETQILRSSETAGKGHRKRWRVL